MNVVVLQPLLDNALADANDRLALHIGADNEALYILKRYCIAVFWRTAWRGFQKS